MPKDSIQLYINGQPCLVPSEEATLPLADFLRKKRGLVGTKIVCAEGDCGACSVLLQRPEQKKLQPINSCIYPMFLLNGAHVVTVEGVSSQQGLHPVQSAMVKLHGSQCGFCTPGFICTMAGMVENHRERQDGLSRKEVQNHLTGNLCRCTGYEPIIQAGVSLNLKSCPSLAEQYANADMESNLQKALKSEVLIKTEGSEVYLPTSLQTASEYKSKNPDVKIVAGATDLGVLVNKGKYRFAKVMSLYQIPELSQIRQIADGIEVGAMVSLSQLEKYFTSDASEAKEFEDLLKIFASSQIKNSGTLIGNIVNASPIGDTLPFLLIAEAKLVCKSAKGSREIPMTEFYLGYKKLALLPEEIVVSVKIPLLKEFKLKKLYKVSLRRDLDISAVTFAGALKLNSGKVAEFRLAYGGVGPTVIRLPKLEKQILGKSWSKETVQWLQKELDQELQPLSDVRGSKDFRKKLVGNLLEKFFDECQP